jgi:hypothetical protein
MPAPKVYEFSKHVGATCDPGTDVCLVRGRASNRWSWSVVINDKAVPTKSVVAGLAWEHDSHPRYLEKLSAEIRRDMGAKRLNLEVWASSKPRSVHRFATWIACELHGSRIWSMIFQATSAALTW